MTMSMSKTALLATLGSLISSVAAHGTVTGLSVNGQYNQGFLLDYYYMQQNGHTPPAHVGWYAEDLDNGFVDGTGYKSADIICHKNAQPATSSAVVPAGATVDFHWTQWPGSHVGPILTYVADCKGNCSSVDKAALEWVKIDEAAVDVATQKWPTTSMIANNNTYTMTMPTSLKPGSYVLRHEIIALHSAGQENGAQNYPQCFNIDITGSGTEAPAGTVGTELYTPTDPGLLFDVYTTITAYDIPGPALFGGGGSSDAPAPAPSSSTAAVSSAPATTAVSSAPATTAVSSAPATSAVSSAPATSAVSSTPSITVTRAPTTLATSVQPAPTTSAVSASVAALYGQCGGTNWTGPTACVAGAKCLVQNPYYSQCVSQGLRAC